MHLRTVLLSGAILAVFTHYPMQIMFGKLVRDFMPLFAIAAALYLFFQLFTDPAMSQWAFRN